MEVNVKNTNNVISKVYKDSIADELGIEVGDLLISINGEPIHDIIEYRFLLSDEYLEVEIQKQNREVYIYEIEKDYDDDLGIEFTNPIIDKAKSCRNKCVFCFIDQLPKGMRETLYFKDDDSRLSFLQGNFVTLTNMSEEDINNIIKYRISPINISVHTTNPELRKTMIKNKFAGNLYSIMERLAEAQIQMNCQIVLCPGYNDKEELERTVSDLTKLYPYVNSAAAVPVGITKHREDVYKRQPLKKESTRKKLRKKAVILINSYTVLVISLYIMYILTNLNVIKTIIVSCILGIVLQITALTEKGSSFISLLDRSFNIF